MITGSRRPILAAITACALCAGLYALPWSEPAARPSVEPAGVRASQGAAEIEADWEGQDRARVAVGPAKSPADDAGGASDGVKDGKWGFHTGLDAEPWWQVDLGEAQPLDRVAVYNRCDAASRNDRLSVAISTDGATWERVYEHGGPTFFGATDGKPLTVAIGGRSARFVRCSIPGPAYFHLDEVEVFGSADTRKNIALGRPCLQSSLSQWSRKATPPGTPDLAVEHVLERGQRLVAEMDSMGVDVSQARSALGKLAEAMRSSRVTNSERVEASAAGNLKSATRDARWAIRRLMLKHPLLSFDRLLFVKRKPGSFSHMSDQHYGWWSRAGGGLYMLTGFREDRPVAKEIPTGLPLGSYVDPDLSHDGKRVLFGYCRFYADSEPRKDKTAKHAIPEDAFYHLYEMNLDGSGLRRLTRGRYDDFSGRYLPDGSIVFLSTRRGATVQYAGTFPAAQETAEAGKPVPGGGIASEGDGRPDSFVRCGGDRWRPVSIYTLHVLSSDRARVRAISPFENFEWTPNVCSDGRILYARWDYIDRDNMPYMKLWSTNPDGTNAQAVYGNYTGAPHCAFEARSIPGSRKILFTGSAHHAVTGGSLVLFDPDRGMDGPEAITRLTPEVPFPEVEGWPSSYYMSPYPLSETLYLTSWSPENVVNNPAAGLGLYLRDAHGNLELLYRDPAISSMYALPIRPRRPEPIVPAASAPSGGRAHDEGSVEATALVSDIYEGLRKQGGGAPPKITALRIVAVPAKTQPEMNTPNLGLIGDDPGKCVLGTVPVEKDGSAYFHVPAGVPVFFQALDSDGLAVQTMRTVTYAQPGKTLACVGCHEPRNRSGINRMPLAVRRGLSRITPGPDGSWPYRFDKLVQPVLDARCVSCHSPGRSGAVLDLRGQAAYGTLVGYGRPSLRDHVHGRYRQGRSVVGEGAAATSPLLALLRQGHQGVRLRPDELERFTTWMDTYAQRLGSFSDTQEAELLELRRRWAPILTR